MRFAACSSTNRSHHVRPNASPHGNDGSTRLCSRSRETARVSNRPGRISTFEPKGIYAARNETPDFVARDRSQGSMKASSACSRTLASSNIDLHGRSRRPRILHVSAQSAISAERIAANEESAMTVLTQEVDRPDSGISGTAFTRLLRWLDEGSDSQGE